VQHSASYRSSHKRIESPRFVYSFASCSIVVVCVAVAFAASARLVSAGETPPGNPIPLVTSPYWMAGLPSLGKVVTTSDLDGDGRLEIVVAMSDGSIAAWDALGNPIAAPSAMPATTTAGSGKYTFNAAVTPGKDVVTATLTALEGGRQIAQLARRMQDQRGYEYWLANDESSVLAGDDEGLTWWRIGGQSLRFATLGRPSFAWSGRLTPDGSLVAAALVGNQLQVFGASTGVLREGVLWRVPRPHNQVQTSLDEDDAQALDKTGRTWWVSASGDTIYLTRDDGQGVAVKAPGPVTHVKLGDWGAIVVSLDDGRVVALAPDGRTLWSLPAGANVKRLDVAHLDGGDAGQVLVMDESPALRLYTGEGQEIAQLKLALPVIRHILADINNDGAQEIVMATADDESGSVIVVNAKGQELWKTEQTAADWVAPLRSGGKVVAVASDDGDEGLVVYSPEGKSLWRYKEQGAVYYDTADLRGDGVDGIILSNRSRGPFVALDGEGKELWKFGPKPNVFMNTGWGITAVNGARAIFESWYTLAAGDNPDQSFVTALDAATGKELWTLRVPQTVWATQTADTDGDGKLEVWAFTWPGTYRLDAETGAYMQVSEAKWSNNWFRVTRLSDELDQVVFFDANGAEAHGLVAEQPPWAGVMRAEAGQAGITNISLSNLLAPDKSSSLNVTLAISLPVAGRWNDVNLTARDDKTGRLLWATTAFGPWDAGQARAYRLGVSDGVYTTTLTGTLAIPAYEPPSVVPIEGERYNYRLPLNTEHIVTATLEVLRPGSQKWETLATRVVPPGSSGEWDVAPFGVWDSEQQAQARFIVDDGVHSGVFATLAGPDVVPQSKLNVEVTASDYRFSGQLRDPHAITLTIELFDPVGGWSLFNKGDWVEAARAIVPAGGGAFATQARSIYDAFDVGHNARYRVWADDGIDRHIWMQAELPPIAGFPWWAYLIVSGLLAGAGTSAGVALVRQRQAQRLAYEMRVAHSIQESLMPEAVPSIPGLDIAGGSTPAFEVGGDFFGYYRREHNALGVAVGDVSGKGLPAALLMAVSVGILAAEANRPGELTAVLDHIDDVLKDYTRRNRLNTALCYVVISPSENGFSANVVNAGSISPLVRRANGQIEWLDAHGLPLGILDTDRITRQPVSAALGHGDMLILMSDGVLEAMDAQRRMFGFERFERAVTKAATERGAALAQDSILAAMRAFGAGIPPHDDVTLVVIRVV